MGHTVMCVCTVYFTAIVGCAFSSPRFSSGEGQQNDSSSSYTEKDNGTTVADISTKVSNYSENREDGKDIHVTPEIVDTGGGTANETISTPINDQNNASNATADFYIAPEQIQRLIQERHLNAIKDQILTKLRLPFPPKLRGPMPQLPLEEIEKVYFESNNDGTYRPNSHYYANTVRKFIPGKDGKIVFV